MKTLLLASQSPRRHQLLQEAGISFQPFSVKVSEIPKKNLNLNEQIVDLARQKAWACERELNPSEKQRFLILSADTMVIHEGLALGKPKSLTEARITLKRLSDQWHDVVTGVFMLDPATGKSFGESCSTKIKFKSLTDSEIENYLATGEYADKAGSYGIQGQAGVFVEQIQGPFDNVVGLPIALVKELMLRFEKN